MLVWSTAFPNIMECNEQIKVWLKYLDQDEISCTKEIDEKRKELEEYDKLKTQISELTKKLEKKVHIPVTRVAFLPATLDHTNEFYTMIGDNHFVRKSSFRTIELIDRRQNIIREKLKKIEEEMELVNQRKEFANQLIQASASDQVEIREPYDESSTSSHKREQHQKVSNAEFEALMKRLDDLDELEEQELAEMNSSDDNNFSDSDDKESLNSNEGNEGSLGSDDADASNCKIVQLEDENSEEKPMLNKSNSNNCTGTESKTEERDSDQPVQKQTVGKCVEKNLLKKEVRFNDKLLDSAHSMPAEKILLSEPSHSILKHTDHIPRIDRQVVEAMNRRDQSVILPESTALKSSIVERDPLRVFSNECYKQQPSKNQKQSQFKMKRDGVTT